MAPPWEHNALNQLAHIRAIAAVCSKHGGTAGALIRDASLEFWRDSRGFLPLKDALPQIVQRLVRHRGAMPKLEAATRFYIMTYLDQVLSESTFEEGVGAAEELERALTALSDRWQGPAEARRLVFTSVQLRLETRSERAGLAWYHAERAIWSLPWASDRFLDIFIGLVRNELSLLECKARRRTLDQEVSQALRG